MSDRTNLDENGDLLRRAKEIVNKSTAHARNMWERNHCIDWVMSVIDE